MFNQGDTVKISEISLCVCIQHSAVINHGASPRQCLWCRSVAWRRCHLSTFLFQHSCGIEIQQSYTMVRLHASVLRRATKVVRNAVLENGTVCSSATIQDCCGQYTAGSCTRTCAPSRSGVMPCVRQHCVPICNHPGLPRSVQMPNQSPHVKVSGWAKYTAE